MVKLFTIIVTYNGANWIERCIESLLKSTINTAIIVVDNASSDETISLINEKFNTVIILPQQNNLGFGKANNIGISYALQNGADYVFLLNQDAFVEEHTLEKLIETSKEHSDFGILSPIQLNWEGTQLEYYFAQFIAKNRKLFTDYILKRSLDQAYEVPFVNAAAWLIPKKVLVTVGGFDPIFRHYGEDNNYCQRVEYHGFKIGVVPNTYIFHDSNIRKEPVNYLFSDAYYFDEVKNLQIKYADINKSFSQKDFYGLKNHIKKLIVLNLLKFNLKSVKGYLKKYKIFGKSFDVIEKSKKQNILKGPHYLDK